MAAFVTNAAYGAPFVRVSITSLYPDLVVTPIASGREDNSHRSCDSHCELSFVRRQHGQTVKAVDSESESC